MDARDDTDPIWLRALLAFDRLVVRAHDLEASLRDELAWSCVPPDQRDEVTAAIYGRNPTYVPGGGLFEGRLFAWEERLLARADVPRSGRVLVGAAGGGRELRVLCERGYDVTAFEPSEGLVRAASAVARSFPRSRVIRGAYADLDAAVRGEGEGEGPLASLRGDAPYALVILGWRSLSHVLEERARLALFAAIDVLAPGAPIVVSFLPRRATVHVGRVRRTLRRALATLGAPSAPPAGAAFIPAAGFAVTLSAGDMERVAAATGRALVLCETEGEGIALFAPRS